MTGEQRITASRQRVWEGLNDPDILKQCMPGCQSLEKDGDDRFKATVAIKVGPIGAKFAGAITLSDLNPPSSYTITGEGQGGAAGFAKGGAKVHLVEDNGATLLSYEVDAQVGGRLAQLGGALIDATAKQIAGTFFKRFGEIVGQPAAAPAEAPLAAAPSSDIAAAAPPASAGAPPLPGARRSSSGSLLSLLVAALAAFLAGLAVTGSLFVWDSLAIGALMIILAVASYEFGRRGAAPTVLLDEGLLQRLTREQSQ